MARAKLVMQKEAAASFKLCKQGVAGGRSLLVMQNLMFEKAKWTPATARAWLKKHNYKPIKRVDAKKDYLHYRLKDPDEFIAKSFRTKELGKAELPGTPTSQSLGIKTVMGQLKKKTLCC